MANAYYGIPDVELIQAVALDLDGADPDQIMEEAIESINI